MSNLKNKFQSVEEDDVSSDSKNSDIKNFTGLYVLTKQNQRMKEIDSFIGNKLILLVVVDPKIVAGNFEDSLIDLERKAQETKTKLNSKNIECNIIVEWGDKTESIANTIQRENAKLLNKD